ncbi:MAG TPA: ATPase, T2SS/T4P/T4SS family [Lacipirellulaceae bacterium]|nr:ATPase, T2SS/T4P/T4SS family [Lacipirellulaceae bacterium]HMP08224.1 ATPase, T2SS/T4P/T4SS family [Lacipirellulaceae bacterium]
MDLRNIYQETLRHFLRPIQPLLDDPAVTEVLINGHDSVYCERGGQLSRTDVTFASAELLMVAVRNLAEYVNRPIGDVHHSMDARLPDGSRVHVIVPPCSRGGVHVSIRKFKKASFSLQSLVEWGSINEEAAEFLRLAVQLHKNTIIAGGTGTGKTSFLNALSTAINPAERVVVIEDSSELQLQQPHVVYLESCPPRPDGRGEVTIRDLFVDALRMRPDRVVVGEVRRGEALDMIQSMISGHSGAMATVHATTPRDALIRLETLCMMAGIDIPAHVARVQVASAVHLVLQLTRLDDGSRRVASISEIRGLNANGDFVAADLYVFQARGRDEQGRILGELEPTDAIPSFADEPYKMGLGDAVQLTARKFPRP